MGETPAVEVTSTVNHFHHQVSDGPKITIKIEKNSKGYNWEVSVSGAKSVAEAILLMQQAEKEMKDLYGEKVKETATE
jgi:predicted secreted protein